MSINKILKQFTLATTLAATTVMAQTPYDEGQKALRNQQWMAAAEQFELAVKADKDNADAAMYWRAHALYKAGRKNEAERQVRSLERKYSDSRWLKEAQALQIEHQGAVDASGLDEELRMFALAQLMDRDPERATPLVLDMMRTAESENIRRDAMFVLGMSEEPAALKAVADIARDSADPGLQAEAIEMLGVASTKSSLALLEGLYNEAAADEVKRAVIHAHIASDFSQPLVAILASEQDPALQREIIHALGAMDATDELKAIYPTLQAHETRVAALEAFFIAGDVQMLQQVLTTETDPELRKTAIEGIAMEGGEDSAQLLESIYDNATTVEEKRMVLDALWVMDDAGELALKIVRTEPDVELRRQAIHALGALEATTEMAALYQGLEEKELRKTVLESMMIADDTDGLIDILKSEQDVELRAAAIEMLALSDDDDASQYLLTLYPNGSREEKQAVIHSMMIMENAKGLLSLLKNENDPELKREMLQMLTVMDSEESDDYLFELLENKG